VAPHGSKKRRETCGEREDQVGQRKENPGPGRIKIQQIGTRVPNEVGLRLRCGNPLATVKDARRCNGTED
jgi:hypothetical protein